MKFRKIFLNLFLVPTLSFAEVNAPLLPDNSNDSTRGSLSNPVPGNNSRDTISNSAVPGEGNLLNERNMDDHGNLPTDTAKTYYDGRSHVFAVPPAPVVESDRLPSNNTNTHIQIQR